MADLPLTAWSDEALVTLLTARADLMTPLPGSLASLAERAVTPRSLARAVGLLDEPTLRLLDAVLALSAEGATTTDALATATGLGSTTDPVPLPSRLALLCRYGLLLPAAPGWRPVRGLAEVRAARPVASPGSSGATDSSGPTVSSGSAGDDERGDDGAAGEVGGSPTTVAPTPAAPVVPEATVAAEAGRAVVDLLRNIDSVTSLWQEYPATVLRGGGAGVRDVRRVVQRLGLSEDDALRLLELAGIAGEIGIRDGEDRAWVGISGDEPGNPFEDPADDVAALDDPLARRWSRAVAAWWISERVPGFAGTRGADGERRAPLAEGHQRSWSAPLRRRVLTALAQWPAGQAPSVDDVTAHLTWTTPAAPPPGWAVEAVLREAAMLGLTGAGALAPTGRAVLAGDRAGAAALASAVRGSTVRGVTVRGTAGRGSLVTVPGSSEELPDLTLARAVEDAARAATVEVLPPEVSEVVLQGDLTITVPGRPIAAISALLGASAEIESASDAVTARFTTASLARAVELGWRADDLLENLRRWSRTGVPQALEYAVRDAERRHGGLRVGAASSYLRAEDPVALATLLAVPELGLRLIAPTVAISGLGPTRLAALVRRQERAVLVEGVDGQVVTLATTLPARQPSWLAPGTASVVAPDPVAAVVAMRAGQVRLENEPESEAASVVALLRAAARESQPVVLTMAGADGSRTDRLVRVLRVREGAVLARDVQRETDLTVALHRVVAVRASV